MNTKPIYSSKSSFLPSAILASLLILVFSSSVAFGQSGTATIDQTPAGTNVTVGTTAVTVAPNSSQTFTGEDGSVFEVSVDAAGVTTINVVSGTPSFVTSVGIVGATTGTSFNMATNVATGQTTLNANTGDVNLATGSGTLTIGVGGSMAGTIDASGALTVDNVSGDVNIGGNPVTPGTNVGQPSTTPPSPPPPPPPPPPPAPPSPEQPAKEGDLASASPST